MWKWEAEGQPKAVVAIVHNVYEHHSRYAWLIQKLRSSGFHVVAGDLPGHGETAGSSVHNETFDTYIKYAQKLLSVSLEDGLPLFILGHGLGATVVMRILQRGNVECAGFILSSPWLHLEHLPPKHSSVLTKFSSSVKLDHEITIDMLTRNKDLYAEANEDPNYTTIMTGSWYKELQLFIKLVGQNEKVIANIPVLMHSAEKDKITDIKYAKKWLLAQGLSEFQYKKWKRLYHDVYQEPERDEVYLYTESFMHSVLRSLGYVV
ncbi:alpha/beta hydrolase [Sporosarcina sp. G11-34]|uniref:alpha/beta hydrolase n=1 Tax=Sporosarcina sp. G11-34 TaxID=2849605 RepID=UPI0022A8DDC5|nr:alpha/beta hydrolase [Sporosarcina sp. G11-34]MCZ2257703.1 alpha/beta hydrolase [Sporosarcina sp. G11-34]